MWPWRGPRGEVCVLVTCQVIHKDEDAFLRTDSGKKKNCHPPLSLFLTLAPSHFLMKTERIDFFSSLKKRKRTPSQDSGDWFEDPFGVRRIKVKKHNFKGTPYYTQ